MKKGFYTKFLKNKENQKQDFILVNQNDNQLIVVLNYFENLIGSMLKTALYISIFVFVSVGITAIINPSIRGIFLTYFKEVVR